MLQKTSQIDFVCYFWKAEAEGMRLVVCREYGGVVLHRPFVEMGYEELLSMIHQMMKHPKPSSDAD